MYSQVPGDSPNFIIVYGIWRPQSGVIPLYSLHISAVACGQNQRHPSSKVISLRKLVRSNEGLIQEKRTASAAADFSMSDQYSIKASHFRQHIENRDIQSQPEKQLFPMHQRRFQPEQVLQCWACCLQVSTCNRLGVDVQPWVYIRCYGCSLELTRQSPAQI